MQFGDTVNTWLQANPRHGWLIHSHERVNCHDITTFHGSPFATIFEKPWWRLISLRVVMQLFLERRELSVAKRIVPNSEFMKQQLTHYYPQFAHKLTEPMAPGVTSAVLREDRNVPSDAGVIGFVGREWKRKGLLLAIAAIQQLRRDRPNLKIVVIGPDVANVKKLFAHWQGGYELIGWTDQVRHSDFDVLLHPAKAEPYGMVISEAMAARVPVVVSDVCGAAADVAHDAGAVLPLTAKLDAWVDAIGRQLRRTDPVPCFVRAWREVAQEHEQLYQRWFESRSNSYSAEVIPQAVMAKRPVSLPTTN
jgi:UDP-glucose:(heptosyl)LPS alpha-1,3-glucosyltransferase